MVGEREWCLGSWTKYPLDAGVGPGPRPTKPINPHTGWGNKGDLTLLSVVLRSLFTLKSQEGSAYSGVDDHWFPL